MARVWEYKDGWVAIEIGDSAVIGAAAIFADDESCGKTKRAARVVAASGDRWAVTAPPDLGVTINGDLLASGLRILKDRDSIRVPGGSTCFFSTERLASIEPLPATEEIFCPRCKLPIEPGCAAVCCPQCGVWHHEQHVDGEDDHLCWTYAATCSLCEQATDLDAAEFRWTPGKL